MARLPVSKFVDAVRSDGPENFYVLSNDPKYKDLVKVFDLGSGGVDATIVEDPNTKFTFYDPVIPGELSSIGIPTFHERGVNAANDEVSYLSVSSNVVYKMFGPTQYEDWTLEFVMQSTDWNRSRNTTSGEFITYQSGGLYGVKIPHYSSSHKNVILQVLLNGVPTILISSPDLEFGNVYHVAIVKRGLDYTMYLDGNIVETASVVESDLYDSVTNSALRIGGWNSRNHGDSIVGAVAVYRKDLSQEEIRNHYDRLQSDPVFESTVDAFSPDLLVTSEGNAVGFIEPSLQPLSSGVNSVDLYEDPAVGELRITDEDMGLGAVSRNSKSYTFDISNMTAGISTELDVTTTTDANSSIDIEYKIDEGAYTAFAEGADTIPELDAFAGVQSGPTLYSETRRGSYFFPGDRIDNTNFADAGSGNLLPLNLACVLDDGWLAVSGTDMISLGISEPIELPSTGTVADTAIGAGVFGVEWTGTGISEQITTQSRTVQVELGQLVGPGAWVYLDSSDGGDRTIRISTRGFNNTGGISSDSFAVNSALVPNNEWTYIYVAAEAIADATTEYMSVYVQADGAQSVGDRLYVGAYYLGSSPEEWKYPTTPSVATIDLRFEAKILGDGVIVSNRSRDGLDDGNSFHIEAFNRGFHVNVDTMVLDTTLVNHAYTTAADVYKYNTWHSFRWTFNKASGVHSFYILEKGGWKLIDTGTVAATIANYFCTSHGFQTLETGVNVGGSHMILNSIGFYDGDFGYDITDPDSAVALIGSSTELGYSHAANYEESLFSHRNGWRVGTSGHIAVVDARSNLGGTDFTIAMSFNSPSNNDGALVWKGGSSLLRIGPGLASGSENLHYWVGVDENRSTSGTPFFDGKDHSLIFERGAGIEVNIYLDESETAVHTQADSGTDISNANDLRIGAVTNAISGIIGCYVSFNRTIEEYERRDLMDWMNTGHYVEMEPDWLRAAADFYINANDPVQRSEWTSTARVINLAVPVPSELAVRYTFASADGISNPVLSYNYLAVGNKPLIEDNEGHDISFSSTTPVFNSPLGLPHTSYMVNDNLEITVPNEKMGAGWLNEPWTIGLWTKTTLKETGTWRYLIAQGDIGGVGTRFAIQIRQNAGVTTIKVHGNGVDMLDSVTSAPDMSDRSHFVTVSFDGAIYKLFVDGILLGSQTTLQDFSGIAGDLYYGNHPLLVGAKGHLGTLMIMRRALSAPEVGALYAAGPTEQNVNFSESFSVTSSFSHQSVNWEKG